MLDINPEYMRTGLRKWKDKRLDAIARRRVAMVWKRSAPRGAALLPQASGTSAGNPGAAAEAIQRSPQRLRRSRHAKRREERSITKRPARKLRKPAHS